MKRVSLLLIAVLGSTAAMLGDADAKHSARASAPPRKPQTGTTQLSSKPRAFVTRPSGLVPLDGSSLAASRHANARLTSLGGSPNHTGTVAISGTSLRRRP